MYMKDLRHKMTLRLNDELYDYVNENADKYSLSPSDFIRQCIALHKDSRETARQLLDKIGNKIGQTTMEGLENGTDRKTAEHDKL